MIRRIFNALPGPFVVRIVMASAVVVIALIGLLFFYDWVGSTFLDTGGTLG